jgi:hypothetical protein
MMQFRSLSAIAALAAVLAASTLSTTGAAPSPSAAMLKPIQNTATALNTNNPKLLSGMFASNATIVDEFPPYVWSGSDAATRWLADFGTFAKKIHLTNGKGTLLPIKIFDQSGNRAYIVVPTDFTATVSGKPDNEHGTWTFTLARSGNGWVIVTQTWGTVSTTM